MRLHTLKGRPQDSEEEARPCQPRPENSGAAGAARLIVRVSMSTTTASQKGSAM